MATIVEKAVRASGLYIIDNTNPDISCKTSVIPKRNPMFHKKEIEEGVGRSNKEDFTIFKIGLVFISWTFIKKRKRLIELD
jgi:hypothetical protein